MPTPRKSTKARLIEAALDLFAERGVTETTTKAVAERAQVNEVTLFRNFGNKYRLLLAVIEDSAVFAKLVHSLIEKASTKDNLTEFLQEYAQESLHTLDKAPDLVRSIVGEAGNYPRENRIALGKGLSQVNRYVADYLEKAIAKEGLVINLTPEQIVNLLNFILMGYFVMKSSCEDYLLWDDEPDNFLDSLVTLFLQGCFNNSDMVSPMTESDGVESVELEKGADLPASLVRSLFQQAKKTGKQEYAFVYVLFGAGLSLEEVFQLERSHLIVEPTQHLLQINSGKVRQVPLNRWVMGFRYGSKSTNPLIQWLKTRKDNQAAIFINDASYTITAAELQTMWQELTQDLLTPQGKPPLINQARQTWCVEMLMRGMEIEDLSILSGLEIKQLEKYAERARNKAALEMAVRLDQLHN